MTQFVDTTAIASRLGVEPVTIKRRAKAGRFPQPVYASRNCTLWPASVIDTFVRDGQPRDVQTWLETRGIVAGK
jgi:predicted DNA-binding transcriptional regulator AlpA